jgi:flavin-dependent dehydrogenase
MSQNDDVLVIGGGPAGSTAAALLARAGWRVRLFERDTFPRYHIGESLAPSCRTVLNLSGALDLVEGYGFQIKRGGFLRWGHEDWAVDWSAQFGADVYSWQVERSRFDELLLRNARDQGVTVTDGTAVKKVVFDGDRPVAVDWARRDGARGRAAADFIIDASGRAGVMSVGHHRDRIAHDVFRNVAIWGYWRGARTLPETPEGGLNSISSPHGWYWVIPLGDDLFSVGFVSHRDLFRDRRLRYATHEDMLLDLVAESHTVAALLADARFEPPVRIEQDYSYTAAKFCGPGHVIIGDAACFLDPLLSTGTHLAMYSALLGAACVTSILRGDVSERRALEFFHQHYRRSYERFLSLVSLMYQQYRGKETYFWHAQRLAREGPRRQLPQWAFTKIISGLSDLQDAGYQPVVDDGSPGGIDLPTQPPGRRDRLSLPPDAIQDVTSGLRVVVTPRLGLAPARHP